MKASGKHRYAATLLAVASVLAVAVFVYPHDLAIFHAMRSFSSQAGKFHIIREILEMFRPLGQGDVVLVIAAGMGLCGARRRALQIMLALAVMSLLIWPVKIGVGRERPAFENFQSFPSGDVATVAAFVTPLTGISPWTVPAAVLVTGGVALERVYYGRHYASDALAGAGFGILSAAMAMAILRRWRWCPKRRWFAGVGLVVLAIAFVALIFPRGTPYLLDVLRIWGPLGAFLVLAHWIPIWARKRKQVVRRTPQLFFTSGAGFRLLLAGCVTGGAALVVTPWFMPIFGMRIPLVVMGFTILCIARSLWKLSSRKRPEAIMPTIIVGISCLILSVGIALLPAFHAYRHSVLTF